MINPNNIRELAETLTEHLDTIIPEQKLIDLTEKQRSFLTTLIWLDNTGKKTKDDKHPIVVMKDILGIKYSLDKKETFLKLKFKKII